MCVCVCVCSEVWRLSRLSRLCRLYWHQVVLPFIGSLCGAGSGKMTTYCTSPHRAIYPPPLWPFPLPRFQPLGYLLWSTSPLITLSSPPLPFSTSLRFLHSSLRFYSFLFASLCLLLFASLAPPYAPFRTHPFPVYPFPFYLYIVPFRTHPYSRHHPKVVGVEVAVALGTDRLQGLQRITRGTTSTSTG